MVCKLSFAFSRMSWLKYLFYTDIFLNTYLCMKFSMYTQSLLRRAIRSYFVTSWLNVYQSSEVSIFWILWSLVKPVLSKTALPCWSRLALACPFYIRSSACIAAIFLLIWQPPAFPYRHQYSIIGRFRLNHRVRDVDGCFPKAHRHQKIASRTLVLHALEVASQLPLYRSLSTSCYQVFSW